MKQERGHISHPSIQRKVGFHSPFLPSDCTILSCFFPVSLWERLPKTRWRRDTGHYLIISWTTTFPTRTCSNYIQDPERLPSLIHMVQSIVDYSTISLGFAQGRTFRDNNDNLPQTQLCLAGGHCMFCLTPSTQKSENPPWNIKTLKTGTSAILDYSY